LPIAGDQAPGFARIPDLEQAMLKHRGFPSRLPSSDFQFTIRRAIQKA